MMLGLTSDPLRRRMAAAAAAGALLAGLTGCAANPVTATAPTADTAPTDVAVVEPPVLQPGTAVPVPQDAAVLTLTGRISSTNEGSALRMDMPTLDRLGRVKVTVFDPWTKENIDVQGVWLADLLKVAQTDGNAATVHFIALDDYEIDLSMADVRKGGVLLATHTGDGSAIPVNQGGPTRIVFMSDAEAGSRPELWIWSLESIDVR